MRESYSINQPSVERALVFGHFSKRASQIPMFNLKKSQVYPPLLRLRFTHTDVKERSGDKSIFATCDVLMFGDLIHMGDSPRANDARKESSNG